MFSEQPTILSSASGAEKAGPSSGGNPFGFGPNHGFRKIIIIGLAVVVVLVIIAGVVWAAKKYFPSSSPVPEQPVSGSEATNTPANLPSSDGQGTASSTMASSTFSNLPIEYLSFNDFYKSPKIQVTAKFQDYDLPLNVKIDVMNYYDLSRKLSLDPVLENLNKNGFALIDNPWAKEAPDFYSIYGQLDDKQVPLLITSDFIIYYYQEIFKRTFKDIEENVFYDNLWNINKDLFTAAQKRYEARLASIGNVNDSVLEGERLEAAYFAVALELLKPSANQIASKEAIDNRNLFTTVEANRFSFIIPPYLRDDVSREVKLIRESKAEAKSPVMLYSRDYLDFSVPVDYRQNAKLNNFYLTTKWLNSVFPLNYRDASCPNCLLDREDWRLNMVAASLIAQDFSSLPEIKNKWARIYKVMAFFKGLREDLNYIHYRDSLIALFGPNYNIEELFSDRNEGAKDNLEKLRSQILAYEFSPFQGAWDKAESGSRNHLGLKVLAESYWPNDYIFDRLVTPAVDKFLGANKAQDNVTACTYLNTTRRCNGMALDAINLAYPITNNAYFSENTNYDNYSAAAADLQDQLKQEAVWHTTNYWTTLNFLKAFLALDRSLRPTFASSLAWQDKSLDTAAAAWINLQLPLEKFSLNQVFKGQGLGSYSSRNENSYIEPNINLLEELIANNNMLIQVLSALQLSEEAGSSIQNLQTSNNNLSALERVMLKEIQGETMTKEDNEVLVDFTKQLKIEPASSKDKRLVLRSPKQRTNLNEDLSQLKLMILVHENSGGKFFSVGPVWNYQESQ